MAGTGEIKYPERIKVASTALQEDIDFSKARGRKSGWGLGVGPATHRSEKYLKS